MNLSFTNLKTLLFGQISIGLTFTVLSIIPEWYDHPTLFFVRKIVSGIMYSLDAQP